MKIITRDIVITLTVKLVLLYLLWYFCVKGMHPELESSKDWFLGKTESNVMNPTNTR